MTGVLFVSVLVLLLIVIIFVLILLLGFAFLQVKLLEKIFLGDETSLQTNPNDTDTNQYTPDLHEGEVPLEQFTPNFKRPTKIVFEEDDESHGMAEVEEGDDF
jgi:hypothetical protein